MRKITAFILFLALLTACGSIPDHSEISSTSQATTETAPYESYQKYLSPLKYTLGANSWDSLEEIEPDALVVFYHSLNTIGERERVSAQPAHENFLIPGEKVAQEELEQCVQKYFAFHIPPEYIRKSQYYHAETRSYWIGEFASTVRMQITDVKQQDNHTTITFVETMNSASVHKTDWADTLTLRITDSGFQYSSFARSPLKKEAAPAAPSQPSSKAATPFDGYEKYLSPLTYELGRTSWDNLQEIEPDALVVFYISLGSIGEREPIRSGPIDDQFGNFLMPAEELEQCVQKYFAFQIPPEYIRKSQYYDPEKKAYWTGGIGSTEDIQITDVKQQGDVTIISSAAEVVGENWTETVTLRIADGGFQYISFESNRIMVQSNPAAEKAELKVELKKIEIPIERPHLAAPPASYGNNLLLTYSEYIGGNQANTALYDLDTDTETVLPLYAGWEFRMDADYYYYSTFKKPGEGMILLNRMNRSTLHTETIYTAPEGDELAFRLSHADDFLVWAQSKMKGKGSDGFELWAYDIKIGEAFRIAEGCYGRLTYSYTINNGFVAYYTEDPGSSTPYVMKAYDLRKRCEVFTTRSSQEPESMAYDGNYFAWCGRIRGDALHLESADGKQEKIVADKVNSVDIYLGQYLVYCKNENFYVYSIPEEAVIFTTENDAALFVEGERLVEWFSLDQTTGTSVAYSLTKANSPHGDRTYLYVLSFVPQEQ